MIDVDGKDIFVIGCGPSLKGFNFALLDDKISIGTNHLVEHYDRTNYLIFGDTTFVKCTTYDLTKFKGHIFASYKTSMYPPIAQMLDKVTVFKDRRKDISLKIDDGLYHPTNTGMMALTLALIMKPRKIYLLGYDYYYDNGNMHFFKDYEHHTRYPEKKTQLKVKMFKPFEDYKKMIVNLSPCSRLELFEKKHWRDVL